MGIAVWFATHCRRSRSLVAEAQSTNGPTGEEPFQLRAVVAVLRSNPHARVLLEPTPEFAGRDLGAVRRYLIDQGVSPNQVTIRWAPAMGLEPPGPASTQYG